MDRTHAAAGRWVCGVLLAGGLLSSASGCARVLATLVYAIKGNEINAEFDGLKDKRVVVVCRPPASLEYRYGGADRQLAKRVGELLGQNVKKIDVVKPSEVEVWTDERDWDDVKELAEAVWRHVHGTKKPLRLVSDKPFLYDVQKRVPSIEKAKRLLGYEATTGLDAILDEDVPWIREQVAKGTI